MPKIISKSLFTLAGLSVLALGSAPSQALVPTTTAVILNSGSTNTIGYRIYVTSSGQVSYVDGKGRGNGIISKRLATRFFTDIKAAKPLSHLPVSHCRKSVSFSTSVYLSYDGQQTPDLSCSGNSAAHKLFNEISTIAKKFQISNVPKSQGQPLPPQNF